jgi:hypothetical protein
MPENTLTDRVKAARVVTHMRDSWSAARSHGPLPRRNDRRTGTTTGAGTGHGTGQRSNVARDAKYDKPLGLSESSVSHQEIMANNLCTNWYGHSHKAACIVALTLQLSKHANWHVFDRAGDARKIILIISVIKSSHGTSRAGPGPCNVSVDTCLPRPLVACAWRKRASASPVRRPSRCYPRAGRRIGRTDGHAPKPATGYNGRGRALV